MKLVGVMVGALLALSSPLLAQQASVKLDPAKFDKCMKVYSPRSGQNLGFLAAQAGCHAYIRSPSADQESAALCVAKSAPSINSAAEFRNSVQTCYGSLPVPQLYGTIGCIMNDYLSVKDEAEMKSLMKRCG